MGTGDMIMHIRQHFVLRRLGNHEWRETITSSTFLATIEVTQQTVLVDIKTIASQQNYSGFRIVAGQNVILDITYHSTSNIQLWIFALFFTDFSLIWAP